jgi:hypothetical protein
VGDGAGARVGVRDGADWPTAGWVAPGWLAPGWPAARVLATRRGFLPCCTVACGEAAGLADSVGGAVATLAAGAGAVRAKTIANPTVASAPS